MSNRRTRELSPFSGQPTPSPSSSEPERNQNRSPVRKSASSAAVRLSTDRNGLTIQTERRRPASAAAVKNDTANKNNNTSCRAVRKAQTASKSREGLSYEINQLTDDEDVNGASRSEDEPARAQISNESRRRTADGVTTTRNTTRLSMHQRGRGQQQQQRYSRNDYELNWYERLLPEFVLNLSSPLTGYESYLVLDEPECYYDDDQYELLERERLRRNKQIRRRLLNLMLVAAGAGLFMYYRGRMIRRMGVRVAVNTVKHRLEDGLVKSIQETMGK